VPEIYDKTLAKLPFSQLPSRKTQQSAGAQLCFSPARRKPQGLPPRPGFESMLGAKQELWAGSCVGACRSRE